MTEEQLTRALKVKAEEWERWEQLAEERSVAASLAKKEADVAYATAYLDAEGTEKQREATALVKAADLRHEERIARAMVKSAEAKVDRLRTEGEWLRSVAATGRRP